MYRQNELRDDEINLIYIKIIEHLLIDDFSELSLLNWKSMLHAQDDLTQEAFFKLMETSKQCVPKWQRLVNMQEFTTELFLSFNSMHKQFVEPVMFEVGENKQDRRLIFRVPDYLVNAKFKEYNTEVSFGSLPIETLDSIVTVFGDFVTHKNGAMAYIKIDDMCLYRHQYILYEDNNVRYCYKYIFEPFTRFYANEMMIYEKKNNYDCIKIINDYITTRYSNEMFDKSFNNLTNDELTVLKMRTI